jgi:catechol O-methyltransferase
VYRHIMARTVFPFFYNHIPKNILLILLSLLWLPFTLALTTYLFLFTFQQSNEQRKNVRSQSRHRKTILVTGISMSKGLTIARLLAQNTPHRILAADTESIPFTSPGRYSRAVEQFYRIQTPENDKKNVYTKSLIHLLKKENVDLWISCSSVIDAVEDGEVMRTAQTVMGDGFKAVQFDSQVVAKLHEKDALMEHLRSLKLTVPISHRCASIGQVEKVLHDASVEEDETRDCPKRFILKPIGVDDKARAQMMNLLPLEGDARTKSYLSTLNISSEKPFILQQFINGPEYCTHSLIVRGQVKAFVSCPSSDLLMHYQSLPSNSPLNKKMLEFTRRVCENEGQGFTGHLSFDFLVEGTGENAVLYPIECNPRAHTAIVLFQNTPEMANAYLSCFDRSDFNQSIITPTHSTCGYYWIGHDLVTYLISPLVALMCRQGSIQAAKNDLKIFVDHLLYWREATFMAWDPWPFFVLYHIYWPMQFLGCLVRGQRWSRMNVSTTKMFKC